jgi:hypothetical protein
MKIRQKRPRFAAVSLSLLAFLPTLFAATPARSQHSEAPRTFFLPKTEWDHPSSWTQISPTQYRETYPAELGLPDNILDVVERITLEGVPGTVVYRPDVSVFIPDVNTGSTWIGLRWNSAEWNPRWREMTDVEGGRGLEIKPEQ